MTLHCSFKHHVYGKRQRWSRDQVYPTFITIRYFQFLRKIVYVYVSMKGQNCFALFSSMYSFFSRNHERESHVFRAHCYVTITAINVFSGHTPCLCAPSITPTLSLFSVYNANLNPAVSQKTAACERRRLF